MSAQLQLLSINFSYNSSKYENLKIEYDVEYFPFTGELAIPDSLDTSNKQVHAAPMLNIPNPLNFFNPLELLNPLNWF